MVTSTIANGDPELIHKFYMSTNFSILQLLFKMRAVELENLGDQHKLLGGSTQSTQRVFVLIQGEMLVQAKNKATSETLPDESILTLPSHSE